MNATTPNPKDKHVAEFIRSVVTGGRGLTMEIVPQTTAPARWPARRHPDTHLGRGSCRPDGLRRRVVGDDRRRDGDRDRPQSRELTGINRDE